MEHRPKSIVANDSVPPFEQTVCLLWSIGTLLWSSFSYKRQNLGSGMWIMNFEPGSGPPHCCHVVMLPHMMLTFCHAGRHGHVAGGNVTGGMVVWQHRPGWLGNVVAMCIVAWKSYSIT